MNEDETPKAGGTADAPRESRVSRAQFLAAAGGIAAGAAVGAPLASAARRKSPVPALPRKWDRTADVVVVGSGAAAYAAAVSARSQGGNVLMLEKAAAAGGTTAKSGGVYWIPNNSFMRTAGLTDPKPDALKYMARLAHPAIYDPTSPTLGLSQLQFNLIDAFYDNGSVVVDALAKLGATSVWSAPGLGGHQHGDPDYDADLPEDKAPHGRHVRPPSGGGAGLIAGLQGVAKKQNVPLLLEHRVTKLFRNANGEVVGVQAQNGSKTVAIRARRGVVFGSGGFTQNPDMARAYLRGPIFGGCAVPTNTGDFVQIGIDVGAQLGNMTHAFWAENPLEQALQNSSVPNDIWLPFGDSMIYVNRYGRRVTNEKMVYNERTQVHFDWSATGREYPNLVLMMVYDAAVANNPLNWAFRYPIPMPGVTSPFVISGSTLQELAQNIDARLATYTTRTGGYRLDPSFAANLAKEIDRFNAFAAAGKDDEFRRGETEIQVAWSGPARAGNTKNPTMAAFSSSGPYYCILIGGGTLDTKGGPRINAKAQVLDTQDKPIPGLYGAGNCIASAAGQAYWSAGGTLGPALTFGYLAGVNASKERVKSV